MTPRQGRVDNAADLEESALDEPISPPREDRLRRKLREFGRALSEAISESSEASRRLQALRDEGYALYLLLDGERSPRSAKVAHDGGEEGAAIPTVGSAPAFRLDRSDVLFLRSIGIDPTRPSARRRKS